VHLIRVEQDVA